MGPDEYDVDEVVATSARSRLLVAFNGFLSSLITASMLTRVGSQLPVVKIDRYITLSHAHHCVEVAVTNVKCQVSSSRMAGNG